MRGWNRAAVGAIPVVLCMLVTGAQAALAAGSGTSATLGIGASPFAAALPGAEATCPGVVTTLVPADGPGFGGTTVVIEGTNFGAATAVNFGPKNPAPAFEIISETKISATSPPGSGHVGVWVVSGSCEGPTGNKSIYSYSGPTVKKLEPRKGSAGTEVTINGEGLREAEHVFFGSQEAVFTVQNGFHIHAIAPPNGSGPFSVTVSAPTGTSPVSKSTVFDYEGKPKVTSVSPDTGSRAGGEAVTVEGSGFEPGSGTIFLFAKKEQATNVTCSNAGSCEMTVPAAAKPGTVDVIAKVGTQKGKKNPPADQFTYE